MTQESLATSCTALSEDTQVGLSYSDYLGFIVRRVFVIQNVTQSKEHITKINLIYLTSFSPRNMYEVLKYASFQNQNWFIYRTSLQENLRSESLESLSQVML